MSVVVVGAVGTAANVGDVQEVYQRGTHDGAHSSVSVGRGLETETLADDHGRFKTVDISRQDPATLKGTSFPVGSAFRIQEPPRSSEQFTILKTDFKAIQEFADKNHLSVKALMAGITLNSVGEIIKLDLIEHARLNDVSDLGHLRSLKELCLMSGTSSLQGLPESLCALQVLRFSGADLGPLQKLTNVTTLKISFSEHSPCTSLASCPPGLRSLDIYGFKGGSLAGLEELTELKRLTIKSSPNLTSLLGVPTSLNALTMENCERVGPYLTPEQSLNEFRDRLANLETLSLVGVPALESLKGVPTKSLTSLFVYDSLLHGDQTPHLVGAKNLERATFCYVPDYISVDHTQLPRTCSLRIESSKYTPFYQTDLLSVAAPFAIAVGSVLTIANPPVGAGILLGYAALRKLFPRKPIFQLPE